MAAPPPDPHLAAALRHAPDADDVPPAEVSRAILRAAHEATHPAAPLPAMPLWQRCLRRLDLWLQTPRLAGGAAALALAVVIGSLWWQAPETSPVPQRETLPLPAAEPKTETPPATTASDAAGRASDEPAQVRLQEAVPRAPQRVPVPEARRERQAATVAAAPPVTAAPAPAPAPAAMPPPQPFAKSAPAAPGLASAERSGAEPPSLAHLQVMAAAQHAAAASAGPRADARAPRPASAQSFSSPGWLQQLAQAAAGRWVRQPAGATPPDDAPAWTAIWPPGETPHAAVRLHGRTLWWQEADGRWWTAELPPEAQLPVPPAGLAASAAR